MRLGHFGTTSAQTSTGSSQSLQVDSTIPEKRFAYYVVCTVATHLHRTESGADNATDATTSDCYLAPNVPYLVECFAGDYLSWIRDGSTSGAIYFTVTDGR